MREPKPPKPPTVEDIVDAAGTDMIRLVESTGTLAGLLGEESHRQIFKEAATQYLKVHSDRILDQIFGPDAG